MPALVSIFHDPKYASIWLTTGQELSMAKIIEFRKVQREMKKAKETKSEADGLADDISAIINDYSLTPANRRWILENMLMDVDDQLEQYKRELEEAERKMESLVKAAEKEIEAAYGEFNAHVLGLTHSVKKLTTSSSHKSKMGQAADAAADTPDLLSSH
jgi:protoporphyrinogen oxidase